MPLFSVLPERRRLSRKDLSDRSESVGNDRVRHRETFRARTRHQVHRRRRRPLPRHQGRHETRPVQGRQRPPGLREGFQLSGHQSEGEPDQGLQAVQDQSGQKRG